MGTFLRGDGMVLSQFTSERFSNSRVCVDQACREATALGGTPPLPYLTRLRWIDSKSQTRLKCRAGCRHVCLVIPGHRGLGCRLAAAAAVAVGSGCEGRVGRMVAQSGRGQFLSAEVSSRAFVPERNGTEQILINRHIKDCSGAHPFPLYVLN